jgi:hypothetical protein
MHNSFLPISHGSAPVQILKLTQPSFQEATNSASGGHGSGEETGDEAMFEPEVPRRISYPMHEYRAPWRTSSHDLKASFTWNAILEDKELFTAPVSSFKHVSCQQRYSLDQQRTRAFVHRRRSRSAGMRSRLERRSK